jgi:UDP:flavonoid glycosyltransferase YjiC (YdhE family)
VDLPPQILTPAQGQEAVKRILAESEAQRERDAAELAAKKQRALEAANKWDPK